MSNHRTALLLPGLSPLYARLEPLGYAIMRLTSGAMLATAGWAKVFGGGMPAHITQLHRLGIEPAVPLGYFTGGLEFFGGLMIAVGLLTRPVALMVFIEMLVILVTVMIPRGTGYQTTVIWIGVYLLIMLRGGGRASLDHLLGREF